MTARADANAQPTRLAMWSGPRNISTALLRSWGARADTIVCDEPLYARYLLATDANHPAREAVVAAHETDLQRIIAWLTRDPLPAGKAVFYQKHMAHHLLEDDDASWSKALTNAFLIRDPARMIASFIKVVPNPSLRDFGLAQQVELFKRERDRLGENPPVLDADDALREPGATLSRLCKRVGVAFDDAMLSWEKGPRNTDGVWGPHWYSRVYETTGFAPPVDEKPALPARLTPLLRACQPLYEWMWEARITPAS